MGDIFKFFVDEVFLSHRSIVNKINLSDDKTTKNEILFGAVLIPNIKSSYFPPMHLRKVLFSPEFLTFDYYKNYREKIEDLPSPDNYRFRGTIEEGNYYEIPSHLFPERTLPRTLTPEFYNILDDYIVDSPFVDSTNDENTLDLNEGLNLLDIAPNSKESDELLVYCFNVGQGDSILIIFPNKNVYIIDTNIYTKKNLEKYIQIVKRILRNNKLSVDRIKALIITHKHLDHLRGAENLIKSDSLFFEYFLINFDYTHDTNVVYGLLNIAKRRIPNNININNQENFYEGKVKVTIANPKNDTCNKTVCKDVNDSSIVLLLEYGNNTVLLSGDAGHPVINSIFSKQLNGENILKVSHHGSRTGTNEKLLTNFHPKYAFISAGNHKGFKHPHTEAITALNDANTDISLSKEVGSIVYSIKEDRTTKNPFIYRNF